MVPRSVRSAVSGVSPTVIPLRPRKSFLEQLVMWAVDLITQQWHHMESKVAKTAGLRALSRLQEMHSGQDPVSFIGNVKRSKGRMIEKTTTQPDLHRDQQPCAVGWAQTVLGCWFYL